MPYATPAEVKTFTGNSGLDDARLMMLCDMASDAIDFEIGRPLAQASRTDTVYGTGGRCLFVHWPLVSVSSVTLDGVLVDPSAYRSRATGELWWAYGRGWPDGSEIVVTYTCGFALVDPAFSVAKTVCIKAVESEIDNPTGLSQETIGDWSRSWSARELADLMLSASNLRTQLSRLASKLPPR